MLDVEMSIRQSLRQVEKSETGVAILRKSERDRMNCLLKTLDWGRDMVEREWNRNSHLEYKYKLLLLYPDFLLNHSQ